MLTGPLFMLQAVIACLLFRRALHNGPSATHPISVVCRTLEGMAAFRNSRRGLERPNGAHSSPAALDLPAYSIGSPPVTGMTAPVM